MWGINVPTLMMMLADAPHYRKYHKKEISAEEDEANLLGFFQSKLK